MVPNGPACSTNGSKLCGDNEAIVFKGDGSCWRYTDRDAETDYYLAPDGAANSLQRTADGWLETQPDGLALRYAESLDAQQQPDGRGRLARIERHDQSWTLTYDDELLKSVVDPFDRCTTFTYSDEKKLSKVSDYAGRETLFDVDCGGCLRSMTLPQSVTTSFVYDSRGRMLAYVDPAGHRTSYTTELSVPVGSALNNPAFGTGGGQQFFIPNYNKALVPIRQFPLSK